MTTGGTTVSSSQYDAEAVRAELERVLSSHLFRNARGQSRFLKYVVEESLNGRATNLKEYTIGVEVFDRGETFDPRVNNVVRAEANRIRTKLARFYEEGSNRAVRIDLPKGGYAPAFSAPATALQTNSNAVVENIEHKADAAPQSRRAWMVACGVGLLAGALIVRLVSGTLISWLGAGTTGDVASIAVLPFVNLNGQSEEFLSDGFTDELINSLGRIPGLHVVARTSAFQYKGKNVDVRKIGRELNVKRLLEGTIRRDGDRVRITAQLDDTSNGYRVWSRSFDHEGPGFLGMQREISQAIVDALGFELAAGRDPVVVKAASNRPDLGNTEAYQSYLKGVYFSNKHTGESVERAISFFEEAIALSPDYAPAYSGLARSYSMLPSFTRTPTLDIVEKWKAAALKAAELDPSLGEAHVSLAENYETSYDWQSAEREFAIAFKLDPGNAEAYRAYSAYLAKTGNLDAAIAQARKAVDFDPVSAHASNALGKYLYQARRFDESIDQYKNSLQLDSNEGISHQGLALVFLEKKIYHNAIAESESCSRIMNRDPFITGQIGYAYAVSADVPRAQEILSGLLAEPSKRGTVSLAVANVYLGLRDRGKALDWLERAVDQHEMRLFVQGDPIYDPLRADVRFAALLRRMNLQ
jgi:TolB-like protein/tetratricopeptide (TPR) repeat protein